MKDARDYPLAGVKSERTREHREREETLADHYEAAFTQYPDVLADIEREGLVTATTVDKVDGKIDAEAVLVNEGRRQLALYILRQIERARTGRLMGHSLSAAATPRKGADGDAG